MVEVLTNSKGDYKGKDYDKYIDALRSHIPTINENEQEDKMFEPEDIA